MKKSYITISLILATALCACLVVRDSNADAPSFGGKACVTNCCDKASGGNDYIGCKSTCEKKSDRQKCLSECSEKMQKAYQACLMADCKMDKGLAAVTIKCNKQQLLIARNQEKLAKAAQEVSNAWRNDSQRVMTVSIDVGDDDDVCKKMIAEVSGFGAPDILINSAGINKHADYFENIGGSQFDEVMRTNCSGVRNVTAALLGPVKEKKGQVVILSSAAGLFGMFGYTAYGASKAALIGFAESLGYELRPLGMSVTVVCPPEVDTPMNLDEAKTLPAEGRAVKSMGGFLMPDYVARVIVKGVANRKFFVIPGFSTRFLYRLHRYSNGWFSRTITDAVIRKTMKKAGR